MQELKRRLRESGQRFTLQREAIYAALCEATEHPTAEDLFLSVRQKTPGVSLATVYNTLETLVTCGLARKLAGDGAARYDANCLPHGHTRCKRCGTIADLPPAEIADMLQGFSVPESFRPEAVALEIEGLCSCCVSPDEPAGS
ncbi:MAG: Fur family transcriptional regulator [Armatimonadota bacterium]